MTADHAVREGESKAPLGLLIESACDGQRWDAHRPAAADRAADLRTLVQRVRPHFAAAGITRVAEVTGLDRIGMPVTVMDAGLRRAVMAPLLVVTIGSAVAAAIVLFPLTGYTLLLRPIGLSVIL